MVKPLLLAGLLLALAAPAAGAGGLSLNWGTVCYTETPASVLTFACDANTGAAGVMTASFVLDSTMSDMVAVEWTIEGESDSPALPDWWQLGAAPDCRAGRATFNSNYTGVETEACADWTGGAGFNAPNYTWSGNRVTITLGTAIDASRPFNAVAGQEYYAGGVTILNRQTVGEGSCAGCRVGMRFRLTSLTAAGVNGRRDTLNAPLPGGNQSLRWNYSPDVPTSTALVSSPNPSLAGDPVTLRATVTPDSAMGTVTFADAGRSLGAAALSGGVATLVTARLAAGEHSFTAAYEGDFDLVGSVSPVLSHTALPRVATSVALASSPNPSIVAHSVLLTATVSPAAATGAVRFRDGAASLGTGTLVNGVATLAIPRLDVIGDHALSATYEGDGTYIVSESSVLSHAVVPRIATTATLSVSPSPSVDGQKVFLTATVSPAAASGTVTFWDGSNPYGYAFTSPPLVGGTTTASPDYPLEPGVHKFRVVYTGDSTYAGSQSSVVFHEVVALDSTWVTLTTRPRPSAPGEPVEVTVHVSPPTLTGPVECHLGFTGTPIPMSPIQDGVATGRVTFAIAGDHPISARYAGDATHYRSEWASIYQKVGAGAPPTTLTLTSSRDSAIPQTPLTFTAVAKSPVVPGASFGGSFWFYVDGQYSNLRQIRNPGTDSTVSVSLNVRLWCGTHQVVAMFSPSNPSHQESGPATCWQEVHCDPTPAPALLGARDAPDDQGGFVALTWRPSKLDVAPDLAPENPIESYWILRAVPEGVAAEAAEDPARPQVGAFRVVERDGVASTWQYVDSLPATSSEYYAHGGVTPCDSMAGANPLSVFMIEARQAGGTAAWFSSPDSAYSVDNLAPPATEWISAGRVSGATRLYWAPVKAPDVARYELHRGAEAGFVPGPENLIASQLWTAYRDAVEGLYYYKVRAVDRHANVGPYVTVQAGEPVDVPQDEALSFALEGVRPNPVMGRELTVHFALPQASPARLALYDLGGRCVAAREVGSLGPGRHAVDLGKGVPLAPGVYVVRLSQGATTRTARAVVLR